MSLSVLRMAFGRLVVLGSVCALAGLATACGGSDGTNDILRVNDDDPGNDDTPEPRLIAVSPTIWSAGTTVKVIGSNFVQGSKGKVMIRFAGTYAGSEGSDGGAVDMEVQAIYRASNKVEFTFEPDTLPAGFGLGVGSFTGRVTASNVSKRGAEVKSQPLATTVQVGPSIVVNRLSPYSQSCSTPRVPGILNGELVDMEISVTGMGSGSGYAPIAIMAAYVDVTDQPQVVEGSITDGTSTLLTLDPGSLGVFDDPESVNDQRTSRDVGVSVTATDGEGNSIRRTVIFTVHQPYEVYYDGNSQVVEVFEPQAVTGCLPGGQYGNSFNYSENQSEGRSRGYSLSGNFGVSVWILNVGFGFGVSSSVSSGSGSGLGISHGVPPHFFGAFFRQTSKLLRTGAIIRYDACGVGREVGEAYVTDWAWAPGFNQKQGTCPPLPEPLLSEAGTVEVSP